MILAAAPAHAGGPGISLYDSVAVDGSVLLHTEYLEDVDSAEGAAGAVLRQAGDMTAAEKEDPASVDQATLFAEAAIGAAARRKTAGSVIEISAGTVAALAERGGLARQEVTEALERGGIFANRRIANTVVLETQESGFTLHICPDILDTAADKIRVERTAEPWFSLSFRPADFQDFLRPEGGTPQSLSITVEEIGQEYEPGTTVRIPKIQLKAPDDQLTAPVTLSLHPGSTEPSSLTIESLGGEASASKYNPASRALDARVDASDVYTFARTSAHFPDLVEKNQKLRSAIEALARVHVVYGYSDNTFRPDQAVTRSEFVAFVMRALGRVNNSLKVPFSDVREGDGCYHEIASAYYYGIIKGYDPEHFRGGDRISKTQVYAIIGRILESEMGYRPPQNPAEYLSREFGDGVAPWAQGDIALAAREGLVIRQNNGLFSGSLMMNRGDVALVIYGLYQRLA